MNIRVATLLALTLCACPHLVIADSFAQNFAGTIRQFGNVDGIGLGAPFDGSQTDQKFSGSLTVTDLVLSQPPGHFGTATSYVVNGPSTLDIYFPTQSIAVSGIAYLSIDFFIPTTQNPGVYVVTLDAALQPNAGFGPDYYLELQAEASAPFFASPMLDSLPVTLGTSFPGAYMFGDLSISGVAGKSSRANLLYSNLSPGALAPEPATQGLIGICGAFLLACLQYRWFRTVKDVVN